MPPPPPAKKSVLLLPGKRRPSPDTTNQPANKRSRNEDEAYEPEEDEAYEPEEDFDPLFDEEGPQLTLVFPSQGRGLMVNKEALCKASKVFEECCRSKDFIQWPPSLNDYVPYDCPLNIEAYHLGVYPGFAELYSVATWYAVTEFVETGGSWEDDLTDYNLSPADTKATPFFFIMSAYNLSRWLEMEWVSKKLYEDHIRRVYPGLQPEFMSPHYRGLVLNGYSMATEWYRQCEGYHKYDREMDGMAASNVDELATNIRSR